LIHPLNTPFLAYFKRTKYLRRFAPPSGLVHFDLLGDKLSEVLVWRHHKNLKTSRLRLMGKGPYHVVGLVARQA
jgi:hypothetical protein